MSTSITAAPTVAPTTDTVGIGPAALPTQAGAGHDDSPSARQFQRQAITEHFLTALEDVVWRYRALATRGEHAELYAEVVTAEVAHQLEVARGALHRHPTLDR